MKPEKTLLVARAAIWRTLGKEEILLGQRPADSKNYPDQWEFPGGKIETDEDTSLAAVREVREETKLTVIRCFQPALLEHQYIMDGESNPSSPYIDWLIKVWVTEVVAFKPETLIAQPPEHQSLRWTTLEEAQELKLMPQTDFALPYLRLQQNVIRSLLGLDPLPPIKLG